VKLRRRIEASDAPGCKAPRRREHREYSADEQRRPAGMQRSPNAGRVSPRPPGGSPAGTANLACACSVVLSLTAIPRTPEGEEPDVRIAVDPGATGQGQRRQVGSDHLGRWTEDGDEAGRTKLVHSLQGGGDVLDVVEHLAGNHEVERLGRRRRTRLSAPWLAHGRSLARKRRFQPGGHKRRQGEPTGGPRRTPPPVESRPAPCIP
jgi:hypothetical protein